VCRWRWLQIVLRAQFALWQVAAATLQLAKQGHFSDPPGIPMYMECGKDKDGLRLFQSVRGTNGVEGKSLAGSYSGKMCT
jgi:hypothetical protein